MVGLSTTPVQIPEETMPGSSLLATSVSAALAARSDEIARGWVERLQAHLDVRPEALFSGATLLGHAPVLVRWIARSGSSATAPAEVQEALRGLVLRRLDQAHLLEELMVELSLLQEVMFEAAVEEVRERGGSAAEGLAVGEQLARRLSMAMTQAAGVFNEEAEEERRSDRRKLDSFTRMVSHEMRTPISAAFTAARLLEEVGGELPAEEHARLLGVVGRGLSRATHLLESVMSLALARGQDGAEHARSLRDVVEDAIATLSPQAEAAGVRLEVATPVPAVEVDGRRLGLLLANLLSNAVKYCDRGKGDRWVRLRIDRDRDVLGWRVQVADNGLGIAREEQDKVFRRFYRAHADLARGTGLGLVIAREAAEQLGGELVLESVPGVGSTFVFTVPDPTAR